MNNRWLILAAGCLIQTILGGIYAWSTFVPYLSKDYGLSSGQCGLIFGLAILTFTSTMILAGRVLTQKGPRFTAMIAAGLFTLGYLLASPGPHTSTMVPDVPAASVTVTGRFVSFSIET